MYAKTQRSEVNININGKNYHEEVSWLAIALTPSESLALKGEDNLFVAQRTKCCGGEWVHVSLRSTGCACCGTCCGVKQVV